MFKTETQYALRAAAALARVETPMSIADLAAETKAPAPMLAKVLYRLAQQDMVIGRPGPGGGYVLAKRPEEILLVDLVNLTEGPNFGRFCLFGLPECSDVSPCPLHSVWGPVRQGIFDMIEGHTLADLAGGRIKPALEIEERK
jgi:Rrf2 family iron-sulfur cluster assembly transcriptional regulator